MHSMTEGLRLSPQQRHLWSLQHESLAYYAEYAVSLEGPLNAEFLKKAIHTTIGRHEILRTTFRRQSGIKYPLQVIGDHSPPVWHDVDLRHRDAQQQAIDIAALFRERQPFDFERGPLLRVTLLALAEHRHVLAMSLPALCADAWALRNLVREVGRAYAACGWGEALVDEPVQYAQFSEWQHQLLEEAEAEAGKSYWRQRPLAMTAALILPYERPERTQPGFSPCAFESAPAPETVAKLYALAHQHGTSLEMVLLAAWETLLWQLTGQPDVVIGKLCDGRRHEELHGALGLLAKWLPVHGHFETGFSFIDILEQAQECAREAYKWQEYFLWEEHTGSFGDLIDFPIGFEWDTWLPPYQAAGLSWAVDRQYVNSNRFKIKLSCLHGDDALTVSFHYDSGMFEAGDIQCLARQFQTLLHSISDHPDAGIGNLGLLNPDERRHWLVSFNETYSDYPTDSSIHRLFEEQARHTPQSTAVVFEDQRLSYAELNARANQLAHYLQKQGVGPEVPVALGLDRSLEMVVGILGILKAGGAYVPLDPTQPQSRLRSMLADAQPAALLTQQRFGATCPEGKTRVVYLDNDWGLIAQESKENPSSSVTSKNLAYVMYTSGSTGRPKGVAVEHRQLLNYVYAIAQRLGLPTSASFALVSTFAADLGHTVVFPALGLGGCLHVLSPERASDPEALAEYGNRHPIDCLKIVPSHLEALLASSQPERLLPRQRLVLGGEAAPWRLIDKVQALAPQCLVFNHYGPTEATVGPRPPSVAARRRCAPPSAAWCSSARSRSEPS